MRNVIQFMITFGGDYTSDRYGNEWAGRLPVPARPRGDRPSRTHTSHGHHGVFFDSPTLAAIEQGIPKTC
ncbi:hypothetical protein EVAR_38148_1 [Eumeta japonica]|uniref:Uncharacterized protein n=1 Tax=Eumeta variegata TaxID=151549 RepID=A0A4C1YQA4_EUMVA|nr:hypothetical protein EVAR_38148_1 [Eumeta japonica]